MPSKKGLSQKGHLLGLFFSKVEKQLHIEGNHFLFSFHAMHLRQKKPSREKQHISSSASRPRRRHQASVRMKLLFFFKERNGNEVLLVGTNLNFLEWKKTCCDVCCDVQKKTLVCILARKNCKLLSCVHMCKEKLCSRLSEHQEMLHLTSSISSQFNYICYSLIVLQKGPRRSPKRSN